MAQGLWECPHLTWHINCLEMLAVFQASKQFLPDLRGHHILVRSDKHIGGLLHIRSRHTELMEQIWKKFGQAQVDFRKPWLLYRRRSHPTPLERSVLFPQTFFLSFFLFFFTLKVCEKQSQKSVQVVPKLISLRNK